MAMIPAVGLLWGEGRAADYARFWLATATASDDGVAWGVRVETNDVAPGGLGGEALFTMAYLTVRAAAGATLQLTPILNDDDTVSRTVDGATVRVLQPRVTLAQQPGTPPELVVQTFEIPLLVAHERAGAPSYAVHPRAERLRLRIESIGAIGSGSFRVEQCELEYDLVRRSTFTSFTP